jgi:hypothetical protein
MDPSDRQRRSPDCYWWCMSAAGLAAPAVLQPDDPVAERGAGDHVELVGVGDVVEQPGALARKAPRLAHPSRMRRRSQPESAAGCIPAGATAERIADLDSLTEEQWTRLDEIYWKNDQLYAGVLPSRALKRMYQWHGREWPPKPSPSEDPWAPAAVSASD